MTLSSEAAHVVYAAAWLSFGWGHSVLAGEGCKQRLRPLLGSYYRVTYNAFAAIHLGLIWVLGSWLFENIARFDLAVELQRSFDVFYAFGWLVLLIGLRGYDLGRLIGTRQIRNARLCVEQSDDEPLRLDGLHRYVRHPLYSGGFLILWGRVADDFDLATAVWGSLYLVIGTWFEERRLVRLYGAEYADYRRRVPAFIPWKGRAY